MTTQDKIKATAVMVSCIAEAIREAGPIPSGVLYSALMGHMDLATYSRMIVLLKYSGLVKESNYLLTWVGEKKETNPNAGIKQAYPKGRW